ncbi:glutamate receptor-like [Scylla paramamosain]|uniref:glutamate receptor-like n=1 Tax=Scylla paramamosain TaxID=85552 RepID=UPI0030829C53
MPQHKLSWEEDPHAPDGRRLVYTGTLDKTVQYFAKGMNFTYRYVLSLDRTFGTKLPNGSWTGLMGMIVREETDFGLGPFSLSPVRVAAADHTVPMWTGNMKMVSGLTGLQVDPWGFLLPLRSIVWTATLAAMLGVLAALKIFSSCLSKETLCQSGWPANTFSPVRVLLQQDVEWPTEWWWWERLVLGLWMLTTLVLTRSYAGNLMSLLAVRYLPQPFQTLKDVLDHPSVAMIWEKHSKSEQFLRDAESGMFKEVAELEQKGRLEFHTQSQFLESLSTLVRVGHHVLVIGDITIKSLVASYVSHTGKFSVRNNFFYRLTD